MREEFVDAFLLLLGLVAALTLSLSIAKAADTLRLWLTDLSHKPRHAAPTSDQASVGARC